MTGILLMNLGTLSACQFSMVVFAQANIVKILKNQIRVESKYFYSRSAAAALKLTRSILAAGKNS